MSEPLVFLPGMMCDARLFAPQLAFFSAQHCVTVAPITHGERIDDIAVHLLSKLPARFALAGLSMGGIVAMEMVRRAPERIARLALMDTNPLAETPQVAAAREPQIARVKAGGLEEVMRDEMKPNYLAPGAQRQGVLQIVMEMALSLGPEVFIRQSRALQRRKDQQTTLRRCHIPTMVLCGAHDQLCPVQRHEAMASLIPEAQLRIIENAGHLPTLEAPGAVIEALLAWLEQPFVLR